MAATLNRAGSWCGEGMLACMYWYGQRVAGGRWRDGFVGVAAPSVDEELRRTPVPAATLDSRFRGNDGVVGAGMTVGVWGG